MFCNGCGTGLQPNFIVCPHCGKPVGAQVSSVTRSRLRSHLSTLGTLWIIAGGFFLLPSLGVFFAAGVAHIAIHDSVVGRALGPLVLTLLGGIFLLVGVGGILVGVGLRNRESWARVVAIVLGIIALIHFPFGTALGVYTLWVLISDDGGAEYRRVAGAV
jgi:drug/metabolite transporter (DMT)-like permease